MRPMHKLDSLWRNLDGGGTQVVFGDECGLATELAGAFFLDVGDTVVSGERDPEAAGEDEVEAAVGGLVYLEEEVPWWEIQEVAFPEEVFEDFGVSQPCQLPFT